MKNMKNIWIVAILLVLGVGGYFIFRPQGSLPTTQPAELETPQVSGIFRPGQPAPDTVLVDIEGQTHNLSDFEGKAVVLDFWAAWCPFCIEEMPELQAAQEEFGEDLVMVGVHRTDTEDLTRGLSFAEDLGVDYLLATDTDGSLYKASGGFGMPVAIFISKQGIVTEIKSGPKTAEEIADKIGELVNAE